MKNIILVVILTVISSAALAVQPQYSPGYTRPDGVIVAGRSAPEPMLDLLDPYQFEQPSAATKKPATENTDDAPLTTKSSQQKRSDTDSEYLSRRTANSLRVKDGSYSRSLEQYYYRH